MPINLRWLIRKSKYYPAPRHFIGTCIFLPVSAYWLDPKIFFLGKYLFAEKNYVWWIWRLHIEVLQLDSILWLHSHYFSNGTGWNVTALARGWYNSLSHQFSSSSSLQLVKWTWWVCYSGNNLSRPLFDLAPNLTWRRTVMTPMFDSTVESNVIVDKKSSQDRENMHQITNRCTDGNKGRMLLNIVIGNWYIETTCQNS